MSLKFFITLGSILSASPWP